MGASQGNCNFNVTYLIEGLCLLDLLDILECLELLLLVEYRKESLTVIRLTLLPYKSSATLENQLSSTNLGFKFSASFCSRAFS